MSCKSAIYTANTTPTAINLTEARPTATLALGSTIRRFGPSLRLNGNTINADDEGYYNIDTSVTLTPAVAGDYTVRVLLNNSEIQGARQTITATAAATIAFNVPTMIRLTCCNASANITIQISTTATLPAAVTVENVGVTVTKL